MAKFAFWRTYVSGEMISWGDYVLSFLIFLFRRQIYNFPWGGSKSRKNDFFGKPAFCWHFLQLLILNVIFDGAMMKCDAQFVIHEMCGIWCGRARLRGRPRAWPNDADKASFMIQIIKNEVCCIFVWNRGLMGTLFADKSPHLKKSVCPSLPPSGE